MPTPTTDTAPTLEVLLQILSRLEENQARLEQKVDELIKLTENRLPTEFHKFAHT